MCLWVSEFAGSTSSEDEVSSHHEVINLEDIYQRKQKFATNDRSSTNGKSQKVNAASTYEGSLKELTSIQQIETYVLQYISGDTHPNIPDIGESLNSNQVISNFVISLCLIHMSLSLSTHCTLDIASFIDQSIDLCSDDKCCPYHSQRLVMFQHSPSVV